uniref:Peptidase S1 domain-containing protein n=1 Tax=Gallus gallus TaxID=9031 RepID=A0A8V0X5S5_CHICK
MATHGPKLLCVPPWVAALLLWGAYVWAVPSGPELECGQQHDRGRVVGGSAARPGEWPWQVSLQLWGQHFCGGTLVAPQWVLSAAHCFQGPNGSRADPTAWRAVVGRLRLRDSGGQERAVTAVVLHEGYRRVEGGHDLALIRLETPVSLGSRAGIICLPKPRYPFAFGTPCWITGWGNVAENVSLPADEPLQKVSQDLLSPPICNCLHSNLRRRELMRPATPGMADSGGPISCLSGGRWVQAGVLSFAVGCGRPSGPVLATALAEHAGWLRKHLRPYGAFVGATTAPPPGLEDGKCAGCGMQGGPPLSPPPPHWPWAVSLLLRGGRRCGGALVAERWVLAAAHCFIGNQEAEEWLAVTPNGHQRRGARLALHGAFVAVGRGRDLALLSLDAPLPIGPELRPLCLPYRDHRRPLGSRCWATMVANGSAVPMGLLSVEVTPMDDPKPHGDIGDGTDDTFTATVPKNTTACQPDAGSPPGVRGRGHLVPGRDRHRGGLRYGAAPDLHRRGPI